MAIIPVYRLISNRGLKGEKIDFKMPEIMNLADVLEKTKKGENHLNGR